MGIPYSSSFGGYGIEDSEANVISDSIPRRESANRLPTLGAFISVGSVLSGPTKVRSRQKFYMDGPHGTET